MVIGRRYPHVCPHPVTIYVDIHMDVIRTKGSQPALPGIKILTVFVLLFGSLALLPKDCFFVALLLFFGCLLAVLFQK